MSVRHSKLSGVGWLGEDAPHGMHNLPAEPDAEEENRRPCKSLHLAQGSQIEAPAPRPYRRMQRQHYALRTHTHMTAMVHRAALDAGTEIVSRNKASGNHGPLHQVEPRPAVRCQVCGFWHAPYAWGVWYCQILAHLLCIW